MVSGDLLALGAVAALAAAGAVRRGSAAKGTGADLGTMASTCPKSVEEYLNCLTRGALNGYDFVTVPGWKSSIQDLSGALYVYREEHGVAEVIATPGWEGMHDDLPVQMDIEGDLFNMDVSYWSRGLGRKSYAWTGDPEVDVLRYEALLKPILDQLDAGVHPRDIRGSEEI